MEEKQQTATKVSLASSDLTDDQADIENGGTAEQKNSTSDRAQVHVITDLDVYEGEDIGEKIENLILSHSVVMINRTWCLFSVDAQNFLVDQMNVSVHSVEVDLHPRGKEIIKYVFKKTGHKTTPAIFIKGDFLGGFEEVNSLYASGKLEDEYLKGLSQADRCEAIISSSNLKVKPYFCFPEKVDGNVVRFSGVLTFFLCAAAAILIHFEKYQPIAEYLVYGITIDYGLRLLGGNLISPIGIITIMFSWPLTPNYRLGRPKQFASLLGLIVSFFGSIFFLLEFPYHNILASAFMGLLALATFMEGFMDFCVGCVMFRLLHK